MTECTCDFEAQLQSYREALPIEPMLRDFYADLFERLNRAIEILPESRNKSVARTKLDECWQWLDWAVRYAWAHASPPEGLYWRHPNLPGCDVPIQVVNVGERDG